MKTGKRLKTFLPAACGLAILILDSRTSAEGARSGLELCLRTVIPSLFPFIFLSSLLTSSLSSGQFRSSRLLCRLFHIPHGSDGILLSGLLGGYPVGAKCVAEATGRGQLSTVDAERMLVFCNAAGPAFLFGIIGCAFTENWVPWCLWGIHLLSALCIAWLFPSRCRTFQAQFRSDTMSITQRLRQSLQVMGEICGWIILMRIVIAILEKWCLWYLPAHCQILIRGILELSNGCMALGDIRNTGLRFMFCSVFLGLGGLCVALQTNSAASGVKQHYYIPGKIMQALISFLMAYTVQYICFDANEKTALPWFLPAGVAAILGFFVYFTIKSKKRCGISETIGV